MKRIITGILFLLFTLSLIAAQETATREVGDFDEILAFGQVEVHIEEGEAGNIRIETENLGLDKVITSVSGHQLTVKLQAGFYPKHQLAKIYITTGTLRVIKAQAGARILGNKNITGDKIVISSRSGAFINLMVETNSLEVRSAEGARLELAGSTKALEAAANSGGTLDAEHLVSENVFIKTQVGGIAKVRATNRLEGVTRTGGKLIHYGNPEEKDLNTALGGSVECECGG